MNNFFENLKIHSGYVCAEKQPLESKKKGFTLQETLIALTILGVVAAITIPALINKYIEATNRVKVKKAMAAYEKALDQMAVENGITGSVQAWASTVEDCGLTNPYFKIISGEDCRFQTSDKVWWDITDIEHPIISLNGEIDDDTTPNGKDVFQMVGEYDGSVLRVNDLADSQLSTDEKANLEKLYAFVNKEEDAEDGGGICNGDNSCTVNGIDWSKREINGNNYYISTVNEEMTYYYSQYECIHKRGGRLATKEELEAMRLSDEGLPVSSSWASDSYDDSQMWVVFDDGNIDYYDKEQPDFNVVCISE